MPEYRIPLEGGDILVVSLSVEEPETVEVEVPDAATLGESLLAALGIGRPVVRTKKVTALTGGTRPKRKAPPPEENPDTWLRRTSEASLGSKFKRNTRADGDIGD
jgi:hypothetical protein